MKKKRNNCFLFLLSVPSKIVQLPLTSLPRLSLFLAEENLPYWIPPYTAPFQTLCHPRLLSLNPFQFCLRGFWDVERRRVPCSQDRAALWTQSHVNETVFRSVPFPVTPTTWAASMAATKLFIEIWIITPRSLSWIVISNSELITKSAYVCVCVHLQGASLVL